MFEKEIKFISDFCVNKVKKLGNSFTFEKLSATDLHPTVIRYISAELDYMIYSDRKKLLQKSYFDYTGKQISQHFLQISDEIKKSKKISFEDTEKLIIQAVSFNANFVVRPKWSLIKLIYNDQNSISVDELEVMLKYVYYYDYIKNVLGAYLSKRKVVQLSLTEFELILNKIDRELFKSNSEQLIDNALNSIGDFFNIGGVDKTTVSAQAVEILLKEKNLIEYLMKLRKTVPEGGKKKFSIEDLKRNLYLPSEPGEEISRSLVEKQTAESINFEETLKEKVNKIVFEEDTDKEETTIGELADKRAQEIEMSENGEILNAEEEEKLLSIYDEELKKFEDDVAEAITHKDDPLDLREFENTDEKEPETKRFTIDDVNKKELRRLPKDKDLTKEEDEQQIVIPEKDIVDEMIRDFFGDEQNAEGDSGLEDKGSSKLNDQETELAAYQFETEDESLPPRIESSLEDELLNVFDELDRLGEDISEDELGEDETQLSEFDMIDRDLDTIDRIAFSDEKRETIPPPEEKKVIKPVEPAVKSQSVSGNENKTEAKTIIEPPQVRKIVKPGGEVKTETKSTPLNKIKPEAEEFARPVRKKDLLSYLKRKDVKKIISYVFSGDREDFVTTAERIMDCQGYREASEILRSVFSSYKVSHYSKDAITFTNAVSNYFRQS